MKEMKLEKLWWRVRQWADKNGHKHTNSHVEGVGAL